MLCDESHALCSLYVQTQSKQQAKVQGHRESPLSLKKRDVLRNAEYQKPGSCDQRRSRYVIKLYFPTPLYDARFIALGEYAVIVNMN